MSKIPEMRKDTEYREMMNVILEKKNGGNGPIPESIYLPWKEWDFGQKKIKSDWLAFCIERIRLRTEEFSGRRNH